MRKKDKRERLDIIYEILTILVDGSVYKTMLAHKARLDSRTMDKYVSIMRRSGLIVVEEKDGEMYRYMLSITEKGKEFLNLYRELMMIMG